MAQPRFPTKIAKQATVLTGAQQHTSSMLSQAARVPRLANLNTGTVHAQSARATAARGKR
jgi:hypothetical protein